MKTKSMVAYCKRLVCIILVMMAVESTREGNGMLLGATSESYDYSVHVVRRKELLKTLKSQHPEVSSGVVVLFGGFEQERIPFRQESSFYYFTGIDEPGAALLIDFNGTETLYIPDFGNERAKWMSSVLDLTSKEAPGLIGVHCVESLGAQCKGHTFCPFFPRSECEALLSRLQAVVAQQGTIFTLYPDNTYQYPEQRLVVDRIKSFAPELSPHFRDISLLVAHMRQKKDMKEIEALYKAIDITILAHEAVSHAVEAGKPESVVQAALEYIFIESHARPSFPSIVASGKNSTVLHYQLNNKVMQDGDLVVVDIGAESDYYCADLTRTYPVSGTFTPRQREIYTMVLETQEYIASIAKPGYWLRNGEHQDESLHHLAKKFLQEKGYDQYFPHGIGHYLGMDVHDVGDYSKPLEEGDVFTIEPGIYIPEEGIGVRIEDDYWMVKDGAVCLSEQLPKKPEEIEAMVQSTFSSFEDEVIPEQEIH